MRHVFAKIFGESDCGSPLHRSILQCACDYPLWSGDWSYFSAISLRTVSTALECIELTSALFWLFVFYGVLSSHRSPIRASVHDNCSNLPVLPEQIPSRSVRPLRHRGGHDGCVVPAIRSMGPMLLMIFGYFIYSLSTPVPLWAENNLLYKLSINDVNS